MRDMMGISRDWRAGLRECATVGFHFPSTWWFVRTGHTASGVGMERTDEAMVTTGVYFFATDTEASRWAREHGYR